MKNERYIYDALYGKIYLDPIIWEIFSMPELQRLREVRLCNINSLCLTGGANINRFEHAIGTLYLAQRCIEKIPLVTKREKRNFLFAALLHDAANAAFGHSLEYILAQDDYNPEKGFKDALQGRNKKESFTYKNHAHEVYYFGLQRKLGTIINDDDFEEVAKIVRGEGKFGALISGSIDLDNIDNIYRLSYHLGLIGKTDTPIKLAESMWTESEELVVNNLVKPLIEEWYKVRKNLYLLLLENPEEFSAKCMLTEAVELARIESLENKEAIFSWNQTDMEILTALKNVSIRELSFDIEKTVNYELNTKERLETYIKEKYKRYEQDKENKEKWLAYFKNQYIYYELLNDKTQITISIKKQFNPPLIIEKLVTGRLFPCISIFSTVNTDFYKNLIDFNEKTIIETKINLELKNLEIAEKFNLQIVLHPILDINKTERQISVKNNLGEYINVGNSTKRLLIGVFIRNEKFDITNFNYDKFKIDEVNEKIKELLVFLVQDKELIEIELYNEINKLEII